MRPAFARGAIMLEINGTFNILECELGMSIMYPIPSSLPLAEPR